MKKALITTLTVLTMVLSINSAEAASWKQTNASGFGDEANTKTTLLRDGDRDNGLFAITNNIDGVYTYQYTASQNTWESVAGMPYEADSNNISVSARSSDTAQYIAFDNPNTGAEVWYQGITYGGFESEQTWVQANEDNFGFSETVKVLHLANLDYDSPGAGGTQDTVLAFVQDRNDNTAPIYVLAQDAIVYGGTASTAWEQLAILEGKPYEGLAAVTTDNQGRVYIGNKRNVWRTVDGIEYTHMQKLPKGRRITSLAFESTFTESDSLIVATKKHYTHKCTKKAKLFVFQSPYKNNQWQRVDIEPTKKQSGCVGYIFMDGGQFMITSKKNGAGRILKKKGDAYKMITETGFGDTDNDSFSSAIVFQTKKVFATENTQDGTQIFMYR